MEIRCSRCHYHWQAKGDADHAECPRCKAEAGLEPVKKISIPMTLFGLILSAAVVAVIFSIAWVGVV